MVSFLKTFWSSLKTKDADHYFIRKQVESLISQALGAFQCFRLLVDQNEL